MITPALPGLICRLIGAQWIREENVVVLFEFEEAGNDIRVASEKHYRLVPPDAISDAELNRYKQRLSDG